MKPLINLITQRPPEQLCTMTMETLLLSFDADFQALSEFSMELAILDSSDLENITGTPQVENEPIPE